MQDDQKHSTKGLRAIVIGAGFGGLSSAIELARLGATVQLFESSPDLKRQGERLLETHTKDTQESIIYSCVNIRRRHQVRSQCIQDHRVLGQSSGRGYNISIAVG
jgi:monoamine oxidase